MKLTNIPRYIDINVINYIDEITKRASSSDFDEKSFLNWLVEYDIGNKSNPSAYVKACFKKELDRGTFKPKPQVLYIPNTQVLINELREKGIAILADDSVWLNIVWEHLLNFKEGNLSELQQLNHKILKFMKTKEFSEYKELLMNSNTLKQYNINWKLLEMKVVARIKDWNSILDEFESEE